MMDSSEMNPNKISKGKDSWVKSGGDQVKATNGPSQRHHAGGVLNTGDMLSAREAWRVSAQVVTGGLSHRQPLSFHTPGGQQVLWQCRA